MRFLYRYILGFIFIGQGFFQFNNLLAQNSDTLFSDEPIHFSADFFDQEKPLELSLAFNVKDLTSEKNSEENLPAVITIRMDDSSKIKKTVKIKARGNVRKTICYFPPYMLNFKKSDISDDLPSDVDKIKVVTHCIKSKEYTNYLLKEFVAYKLLNIITDYGFKTRLAKITYIDTGRKNKTYTEWAFLIEPENMLAERLDALPIRMEGMSHTYLDTIKSTIMVMYQYMIGNTDFALANRHNLKLLKLKDHTKPALIPIPYDFDYAGLVNAHYAVPTKELEIRKVTDRYYNGICRSDETYKYVIDIFLEKKDKIFEYINSCDFLDKKTKKYVIYYIDEFYSEIIKPDFIKKHIRTTCF